MIKVCHVTSAHDPEDVRIFHKECVSLANAGYDVYLVQKGNHYDKKGVHMIGVGAPPAGRLARMTVFTKNICEAALQIDADVYHLHDPELLRYALMFKKHGKKVIFDSHEHTAEAIYEKEWLPKPIRFAVYFAYSAYQKAICKKLDAIISVTPNIISYFEKINPNTVQVANYPIYLDDNIKEVDKQRRVVFAGGISSQWNHHILLEALHRIPQCRYCLCGVADKDYLSALQKYPAWEQVDYLGKIPHAEVAEQLAASMAGIALLQPGRNTDWENGTIGNTKIFEEMMAGLPVLCTNFNLWRDFVERYRCGICVDPQSVEQITQALQYFIDNPEAAKEMGQNGRKAIKEEFNWSVEEKKLLALYENLLKNKEK